MEVFQKEFIKKSNCGKGSKDKKIFIKKNLNLVSKKMNIKKENYC